MYLPDCPASDLNGGAGGIRDFQEIGPEVIAELRGKRGIDLEMGHAGGCEASQERFHQASAEPDLIDLLGGARPGLICALARFARRQEDQYKKNLESPGDPDMDRFRRP